MDIYVKTTTGLESQADRLSVTERFAFILAITT